MRKIVLPAYDVPLTIQNGLPNPLWLEKLQALADAVNGGLLGAIDVDNSTPIANTEVLVWDSTAQKFKPGAN